MEKAEHAQALRMAMSERRMRNQALADLLGVSYKSIQNWTSVKHPVMPTPTARADLQRIFPGYELNVSSPIEAALANTNLAEWRKRAVLAEYERHVYEQAREAS